MSLLSTSTIKTMISAPIEPLLHALESIRPLSNCTRVSQVYVSQVCMCVVPLPLNSPSGALFAIPSPVCMCVYVCVTDSWAHCSLFTVGGTGLEHKKSIARKVLIKVVKKLIRKICPTFRHYRLQQFFSSAVTPPCALWAGHISLSVSLCLSLFSLLSSL